MQYLIALLLFLSACTPVDPSFYDLKSPCVSTDIDPCIKRDTSLNKFLILK
jgi:hypothetical protein